MALGNNSSAAPAAPSSSLGGGGGGLSGGGAVGANFGGNGTECEFTTILPRGENEGGGRSLGNDDCGGGPSGGGGRKERGKLGEGRGKLGDGRGEAAKSGSGMGGALETGGEERTGGGCCGCGGSCFGCGSEGGCGCCGCGCGCGGWGCCRGDCCGPPPLPPRRATVMGFDFAFADGRKVAVVEDVATSGAFLTLPTLFEPTKEGTTFPASFFSSFGAENRKLKKEKGGK